MVNFPRFGPLFGRLWVDCLRGRVALSAVSAGPGADDLSVSRVGGHDVEVAASAFAAFEPGRRVGGGWCLWFLGHPWRSGHVFFFFFAARFCLGFGLAFFLAAFFFFAARRRRAISGQIGIVLRGGPV